jgi:hypothetical protein
MDKPILSEGVRVNRVHEAARNEATECINGELWREDAWLCAERIADATIAAHDAEKKTCEWERIEEMRSDGSPNIWWISSCGREKNPDFDPSDFVGCPYCLKRINVTHKENSHG